MPRKKKTVEVLEVPKASIPAMPESPKAPWLCACFMSVCTGTTTVEVFCGATDDEQRAKAYCANDPRRSIVHFKMNELGVPDELYLPGVPA